MPLTTSSHFASASATGTDWRDTSKKVLEELDSIQTENSGFNLGFLYISDALTQDAGSILTLFKSVTGIENWTGCVGIGVFSSASVHIDTPAIAAMVGKFDADSFCVLPPLDDAAEDLEAALDPWLKSNDPMLTLVHGNPLSEHNPIQSLSAIESATGGFVAGGFASSRGSHLHFNNSVYEEGLSSVVFSDQVPVLSFVTQGCTPIGKMHTITHCSEQIIKELNGQRAYDVFLEDLRAMVADKTGQNIDKTEVEQVLVSDHSEDDDETAKDPYTDRQSKSSGQTLETVFKGELHVAFPVPGSDQEDYMVRNTIGFDPDTGSIAVAHYVSNGERMLFVQRDEETVKAELTKALFDLRKRCERPDGSLNIKGGLYISCVARAPLRDDPAMTTELDLIREVLGDIPLAGYYANGEVSNHRLYGYTGVLLVFV